MIKCLMHALVLKNVCCFQHHLNDKKYHLNDGGVGGDGGGDEREWKMRKGWKWQKSLSSG